MRPKQADGIANSVDPNQTAPRSDLGLHCVPRLICPKTLGSLRYMLVTIVLLQTNKKHEKHWITIQDEINLTVCTALVHVS